MRMPHCRSALHCSKTVHYSSQWDPLLVMLPFSPLSDNSQWGAHLPNNLTLDHTMLQYVVLGAKFEHCTCSKMYPFKAPYTVGDLRPYQWYFLKSPIGISNGMYLFDLNRSYDWPMRDLEGLYGTPISGL